MDGLIKRFDIIGFRSETNRVLRQDIQSELVLMKGDPEKETEYET